MTTEWVDACIIGGGPAGMMAGLLLARLGVEVLVLEKHPDFLRDFRGDTVHPSTLQAMNELGLAEDFLKIPHIKMSELPMETAMGRVLFADFGALPGCYPFVAFMPQWDVLNFLAEAARRHPGFRLMQRAEVTELIHAGGEVTGVRASTANGPIEVHGNLVIAADGRRSVVRATGALDVAASVAPMDVLWFRLSRLVGEVISTTRSGSGHFIVCINRDSYWQIAYMIPRGEFGAIQQAGLAAFRAGIAAIYPAFTERLANEIRAWDDVKPLDVQVDRLRRWYRPGLLAIGDAAHAMSPAGGVGINLAIQDAIATARIVGPPLAAGDHPPIASLRRVQRRRQFPMRVVQLAQLHLLSSLYPNARKKVTDRPLLVRLLRRFPALPQLIARVIGLGVRPERIPDLPGTPASTASTEA